MSELDDRWCAHLLIKSFSVLVQSGDSSPQCRPTIYDTAMVAMLSKPTTEGDGIVELVYPDSFQYLLDHQQVSGGWEMHSFRLGTILNTLAGLLAIAKCRRSLSLKSETDATSLDLRATKATSFIQEQLDIWDHKSDGQSGSIILVPALLAMLRAEDIHFRFHGSAWLERRRAENLRTAEMAPSESNEFNPALYYLEAYVDVIEPQHLEGSKVFQGISCSPSSTAAFLLGSEVFDEEYKAYISAAIKATGTSGGVPSVYPSSSTEVIYAVEVLLDSGLSEPTISVETLHRINGSGSGEFNFSSVHSTKSLCLSSQLLIYKLLTNLNCSQIFYHIEDELFGSIESHDLRFEEGCRILKTLLRKPRANKSAIGVSSLFDAICALWWAGSKGIALSRSPLYSIMLFAEAFADIYELSQSTTLTFANAETVKTRGPIIIVQMLAQVLSSQNSDGSWGPQGCSETTAYAILALIAIAKLPHLRLLYLEVGQAIERGRQVLSMKRDSWARSHSLWIGKTSYGSDRLAQAFALAAMQKEFRLHGSNDKITLPRDKQSLKILALAKFFHGLENLAHEQFFKIKAGALESAFYVSMLKDMRNDIFPPTAATENDKYFDYIPIMWTIHGIIRGIFTPPQFIWDIAVLSMFIFLVDEYMESKVAIFTTDEFSAFRKGIEVLFALDQSSQPAKTLSKTTPLKDQSTTSTVSDSTSVAFAAKRQQQPVEHPMEWTKQNMLHIHPIVEDSASTHSDRVRDALSVFSAWASYHMTYESVLSASTLDLLDLRMETRNYLLYHIHQLEDNQRLAQQQHRPTTSPPHLRFRTPRMSFAPWLHSVGGGHIGAPIGLVFFACVVGGRVRGPGKDCFSTVRQKLMAWNCNSHAAKQLRMYNDYGSVARDAVEDNLSSVNFPEFFGDGDESRGHSDPSGVDGSDRFRFLQAKQTLLEAAKYERQCTNVELAELYEELRTEGSDGAKIADWLGVYYAGGDQFSDMYLVRDVTNSTKQTL